MDTSPSTLREQGVQALRQGNIDQAIDLLARAVLADSRDADAQAFLGVAYSQKGLHAQAKRALQTAVELQPTNPSFQFNRGVALEQAGDRAGAAAAYRAVLELNPEHAQARARLNALGAPAEAIPPPTHAAPPAAPWLAGRSEPGAPPAGPPGTVQCPNCGQWSKPGLSCEWCSAPLKSAPAPSTAPWLQGAYSSAASAVPETGYATAPDMSAGEAFGRRFAAVFIDGILLGILNQILIRLFFSPPTPVPGAPPNIALLGPALLSASVVSVITTAAYAGGMLAARGQTLGKMALGLRVVGPDGNNPSLLRALLREVPGKWISGVVFCLGYLWMLWDEGQQTWHDKIAGTTVERA